MMYETSDMRTQWLKEQEKKRVLKEAKAAIAWGYSDKECTGYSPGQFISVIQQLLNYIEKHDK